MIRGIFLFVLISFGGLNAKAQDTSDAWFPGGDQGFYRYLEDRMYALGSARPDIGKNGESVIFEFYVTDSGWVDSIKIQQCFNFQLCFQLRQILQTMPRVNAASKEGKTISERHVFVLNFRLFRDGYLIEPIPQTIPYQGTVSSRMKWLIVIAATIAMLIVVFK